MTQRYERPPKDRNEPFRFPNQDLIAAQALKFVLSCPDTNQLDYVRALATAAGVILRMSGSDFQSIHAVLHNVHPIVRELTDLILKED